VHERHENDAGLRAAVFAMARDTGAEAFARQQAAIMGRIDSRPGLSAITCPTMIVVGDGDRLTPPERAREMQERIAGSRLEIIANCGHLPTLEAPDETSARLVEFLNC
jgi:pimeloyl-ACP methyl ester carboxylesterase